VEKLSVLIFGAGAIGTYIGGSLVLTGHKVVFLEQPGAVKELQRRGLHLEIRDREGSPFTIPPSAFIAVESLPEALRLGSFDLAIYALKSFDTDAALEDMKPYAAQMPPIVCLSNGVENEAALASVLGADKVIAGTVTSSVARGAVGEITLEKLRGVGLGDKHPLSLCLWKAFFDASLKPRLYPRPIDMKWSKMLTNLMANATVAILDLPPSEVLAHPGLYRIEIAILREAMAVMKAQGIRVVDLPGTPVRLLALAAKLPSYLSRPLMGRAIGGGRGGKMPSFHIDLHAGRGKSEVEWLNGAVVRYGEKFGVPTPVNKLLNGILMALTRAEIPLTKFSRRPDKLLEVITG
jgi:2-dehydropantoate 2-reductase